MAAPYSASSASEANSVCSDNPLGSKHDDFYPAWEKFCAVEPKRAKKTSRSAKRAQQKQAAVEASPSDGLKVAENAVTSYEQAASKCRAKVEAIIQESILLNKKYRDANFKLEQPTQVLERLDGKKLEKVKEYGEPPPGVKRIEDIFEKPEFFIDGATATDVHQGQVGDCWFLASLMAVTAKKGLIEKLCVKWDPKVGVYGFVFYRDGEWIYEVVDDRLYLCVGDDDELIIERQRRTKDSLGETVNNKMQVVFDEDKLRMQVQKGAEALYFAHCKSNETWLPLIEKAYAKAHGDYASIEGGHPSEGIEDLTGGVCSIFDPEDIMDKDRFWREQLMEVNKTYLFGGSSQRIGLTKGILGGHAYAVLQAFEEGDLRLLKIRNPWGNTEWEGDWSDGSKQWTPDYMRKLDHTFGNDGVFWITYQDFLSTYTTMHRARLFDESFSVSQQWTSVNIPWTVDYLDTKFQVTIKQKGPVVFVLQQPDNRYFYGIEGRYRFALHFRLYRCSEKHKYIARSMYYSSNDTSSTRSTSVEVDDLEPGEYSVIFKVTPTRYDAPTSEEAILRYAHKRKEKLLQVGRRYHEALSRGNRKALEVANREAKKVDASEKKKAGMKSKRRRYQKEKAHQSKLKQRIANAKKVNVKEKEEEGLDAKHLAKSREETDCTSSILQRDVQPSSPGADKTIQESSCLDSSVEAGPADADRTDPLIRHVASLNLDGDSVDRQGADNGTSHPPGLRCPPTAAQPKVLKYGEDTELIDDDFDWDSDIDAPPTSPSDGEDEDDKLYLDKLDSFKDDPWNAICVLGLRVYSQGEAAQIRVVKEDDSDNDINGDDDEGMEGVGVGEESV